MNRNAFRILLAGVILLTALPLAADQKWHVLKDKSNRRIEAKIRSATTKAVTLERRDGKVFDVPLDRLSAASRKIVSIYIDPTGAPPDPDSEDGDDEGEAGDAEGKLGKTANIPANLPKRLYPMQLAEIEEGIEEIRARKPQSGFAKEQWEGLQLLNTYRFLCGVPCNVKLNRDMVAGATDAANACQKHGSLSHDLGHSTEDCNLHQGQSSIVRSVKGFIEDSGANNRPHRGHRLWCLNPPMKETGFGKSKNGRFYGMWAMNSSGKGIRDIWAYPGRGLFPLKYLHGNGWSVYLNERAPARSSIKVEVYKLTERPEKPFGTGEIPGQALPVSYISTERNCIVFEPTGKKITESGIYYVRIRGGEGLREQYVVELF